MTLYIRTTADKYELPIAVADSPKELAQMLGGCLSGGKVATSALVDRSGLRI